MGAWVGWIGWETGLAARVRLGAALLLLGVADPAWGAQATLVADAHVNSAMPTMNSGTISNLNVGGGFTTFLQFDLSLLPAGTTAAQVSRAVLRLYANRVTTPGLVSYAPVSASWGEYSVTYAAQPAVGAAAGVFTVSQGGAYVAVDVTALVQGWVTNPATNNGLALSAGTAVLEFDSKENDETSHAASLEVELVDAGPAGATGSAGAAGVAGSQGAAGAVGPMGLVGLTGPAGAAGAVGPAGVAGAVGATGATGPAGAPGSGAGGLVYLGAYASTTNYALGDVVVWQGSSYVSLIASNDGNTPSVTPLDWGLLAAQGPVGLMGATGVAGPTGSQGLPGSVGPNGPQGAQGIQGIAGQAGAQGIPGAAGATGLSGPAGPQGVAGPVGLSFQGVYSSVTNYALADGVSYNGAGYVSLVAANHGNTPDVSPTQWALFAAAGATGATGGLGLTGAAGAAGATGVAGPQGLVGATGAVGAQGPPVANYLGNYQSSVNYALNDAVSWQGSTYVSLVAGNLGNTPSSSPIDWAVLAAQGATGAAGATGATGVAGATGAVGATGSDGVQGPPVTFSGEWAIGTQYGVGAAVAYGGSSYVALTANVGREPDLSPTYWAVLAAGATGATGAMGATGLQGAAGFPGPTGATGAVGATGAAGASGANGGPGLMWQGAYSSTANYAVGDGVSLLGSSYISLVAGNVGNTPGVNPADWSLLAAVGSVGAVGATGSVGLTGPAGVTGAVGATGATGSEGAAGINFRGPWASGTGYAVNDAVTFGGATYLAQETNSASEPDLYPLLWAVLAAAGGAGPTGPAGPAATVSVGMVSTGAAGSIATVTNVGTSSAAVLNFSIPQGTAGMNGTGGSGGGTSGIPFQSTYHAVSDINFYYSVNSSTSNSTESDSVLTWVPSGCTATELTVFSQQANTITVTLRAGASGSLADTALSCSAMTGGSCTGTVSVPVAAGSFVDLHVINANGTAAGVWTAVACN